MVGIDLPISLLPINKFAYRKLLPRKNGLDRHSQDDGQIEQCFLRDYDTFTLSSLPSRNSSQSVNKTYTFFIYTGETYCFGQGIDPPQSRCSSDLRIEGELRYWSTAMCCFANVYFRIIYCLSWNRCKLRDLSSHVQEGWSASSKLRRWLVRNDIVARKQQVVSLYPIPGP
jgi:hypothetical protein